MEVLGNWKDGHIRFLTCSPLRLLVAAQIFVAGILQLFMRSG